MTSDYCFVKTFYLLLVFSKQNEGFILVHVPSVEVGAVGLFALLHFSLYKKYCLFLGDASCHPGLFF